MEMAAVTLYFKEEEGAVKTAAVAGSVNSRVGVGRVLQSGRCQDTSEESRAAADVEDIKTL